ncbi:CBS domain-containing protein [Marinobacteraceae bacterium S3BR75-40.1]
MPAYHALPVLENLGKQPIHHPATERQLRIDDPAVAVINDFAMGEPHMVDNDLPVTAARRLMAAVHLPWHLVIDKSGDCIGLITLKTILGKKALATANEMGTRLDDILVRDIMQPFARLRCLHLRELQRARVGDVLETLTRERAVHLLVVEDQDRRPGHTRVRGLIAADQVARALNVSLHYGTQAHTFLEIVHAVHGTFD